MYRIKFYRTHHSNLKKAGSFVLEFQTLSELAEFTVRCYKVQMFPSQLNKREYALLQKKRKPLFKKRIRKMVDTT